MDEFIHRENSALFRGRHIGCLAWRFSAGAVNTYRTTRLPLRKRIGKLATSDPVQMPVGEPPSALMFDDLVPINAE